MKQPFPPSTAFGFWDLPPEIRDMVYHQLWKSTPDILLSIDRRSDILRPSRRSIRLMYGTHKTSQSRGLPLWLLTNKSVLTEGLGQLRLHQLHTMDATDIRQLSVIGATFNFLAGPSAATHLPVTGNGYKYVDLLESAKAASLYAVSENCRKSFEAAQTPNLKVLKIHLVVAFPYECLRKRQSLDLSFFEATNVHLERLVVKIVAETCDVPPEDVMDSSANICKLALAEVIRLGQLLVGSGAVVEVHDGAHNNHLLRTTVGPLLFIEPEGMEERQDTWLSS